MNADGNAEFVRAIGPVARELRADFNAGMSSRDELRFGTGGSLSVDLPKGVFKDHETGEGGGTLAFVMRERRTDKVGALQWLRERGHIPTRDRPQTVKPPQTGVFLGRVVATYPYVDEHGEILFEVTRHEPKTFRQRQPKPGGGWIGNIKGVRRVLYRLPTVLDAVKGGRTVYVVEGEKDVHAVETLGLTATCSPGGAKNWRQADISALHGADVVILPDNDAPGRGYARDVEKSLTGIARTVRGLALPDLPDKGDVADWIEAGGTAEELARLVEGVTATVIPPQAKGASIKEVPTEGGVQAAIGPNDIDLSAYQPTEDGIALAFEAKFAGHLRYDHNAGAWFEWTGARWKREETQLAFHWCRTVARDLVAVHEDAKAAITMARAASARGVEALARAARAFAVTSAVWDTQPFLLGTPDGTVDLSAGQMRAASQDDCITRLTAVAPAETPDCPLWDQFLWDATGGDREMIRFLRAWCGYCLTGDTREHALVFVYGPGGNGKSVFLNTITGILGDYANAAAMETFTATSVDRHPTDLAMLRGARLVTASETEEGRPWAEARIKQLTGGDAVTARFMRQDFFTYKPHFKLTIVGNHMPVLHSVDDAMRRRFNVVGFTRKPQAPDPQLEAKLRAEWPAILRWAIDGCLDWQMNGLPRPEAVLSATEEYFREQDVLGQFLETCCIVAPDREEVGEALFGAWMDFAKRAGEDAGSGKRFASVLQKRGFQRCRDPKGTRNQRGFRGLELRPMQWLDGA